LNYAAKLLIINGLSKQFLLFVVFYFCFLWYFTFAFCGKTTNPNPPRPSHDSRGWSLCSKGELPRKQTFESRVLSTEPKFVQKRRQNAKKQGDESFVSTFGKENTTKNEIMSTFVNRFGPKTTPVSTLENINQ